jgi:predicted nucleic acid-binding protein
MKRYLDSSVLVESCLRQSTGFERADKLVNEKGSLTSAHALAETYATLSGDLRLKIRPAEAAQMVDDLANLLSVHSFEVKHYRDLIASAPAKGIRGGTIYDALHAQTARLAGCEEIHTLNLSHFKHVAPDVKVIALQEIDPLD